MKYLRFQESLDFFSTEPPIRTGSVNVNPLLSPNGQNKLTPLWADYVDMFHLVTHLELSDTNGSKVLEKFKSMLRRHSVEIPLPKLAKSIRLCIERQVCSKYKKIEVHYKLPTEFFNSNEVFAQGMKLGILDVMAEQLLRLGPSKVHIHPMTLFSESGERVMREPATADRFRKYFDIVREKYGLDYYPLCVMISGDGLFLNKTGSTCATPWYCQIANMTHDVYLKEGALDCVGFSPKILVSGIMKYIRFM